MSEAILPFIPTIGPSKSISSIKIFAYTLSSGATRTIDMSPFGDYICILGLNVGRYITNGGYNIVCSFPNFTINSNHSVQYTGQTPFILSDPYNSMNIASGTANISFNVANDKLNYAFSFTYNTNLNWCSGNAYYNFVVFS